MAPATIWLMFFLTVMPDGRHLRTYEFYPDEAHCLAAGEITVARLRAVNTPANFTCARTTAHSETKR